MYFFFLSPPPALTICSNTAPRRALKAARSRSHKRKNTLDPLNILRTNGFLLPASGLHNCSCVYSLVAFKNRLYCSAVLKKSQVIGFFTFSEIFTKDMIPGFNVANNHIDQL